MTINLPVVMITVSVVCRIMPEVGGLYRFILDFMISFAYDPKAFRLEESLFVQIIKII